ncbi:hypothetical protein [Xanthobacter versatilis]|uniref:hypothetical protein n=1 Tax=Xanthobacter autotrophicus (strain ATCC BAA-1158 / Py2) TaxID=78245 RepID=UPI003726E531
MSDDNMGTTQGKRYGIYSFFTKSFKGRLIAATATVTAIIAFSDSIVQLAQRVGNFTCSVWHPLPWCEPVERNLIWSNEAGGPGGQKFGPFTCDKGEALVGLFGRAGNGPFVISAGPICAPVSLSFSGNFVSTGIGRARPQDEVGGQGGSPYDLRCPANSVAIGFDFDSAIVNTNFGQHEFLVAPLKLRCSDLSKGSKANLESVAAEGGRVSNASHRPFQCPAGSIGFAIQGRSGDFVDAIGLGCRRL